MDRKLRVTVFTPTYNRAYIIENLYRSLQRQAFTDFEWLIVDDGSADNTEEIVCVWQKEKNPFPIRYYKIENGGKCRAINYGLDLAFGELFFTVDSDDYLTDDALEKVDGWFKTITDKEKIAGIVANRGYSACETLNYIFPESYRDCSLLEMYNFPRGRNTVGNGERAFVFYTDFHRKYKYPEFEGEKFMTEAVVWNRMAHDGYQMRFFNDIIWIFEYREDGLTNAGSRIFIDNPCGYGLWLREKQEFLDKRFLSKMRLYYTFTCDLWPKYSAQTIARAIHTNICIIYFDILVHKVLQFIKKDI